MINFLDDIKRALEMFLILYLIGLLLVIIWAPLFIAILYAIPFILGLSCLLFEKR